MNRGSAIGASLMGGRGSIYGPRPNAASGVPTGLPNPPRAQQIQFAGQGTWGSAGTSPGTGTAHHYLVALVLFEAFLLLLFRHQLGKYHGG